MKKIALAFLMLLSTMGLAFAQSDLQVLAIVKLNKNESITVKQVKSRVGTYEKQTGRTLSVDDRKKVLDAMIEEKVMLQAALKSGISIADSDVDQYFMQGMSQQLGVNVSEKELNDIVQKTQGITLDELLTKQVGMNIVDYKNYLKNTMLIQQYVIKEKQAEIQSVTPTDDEIRAFYESNKASFVWTDMMKAFLVVVSKGSNKDAAVNKANELRNKLNDGKVKTDELIVKSKIEGSGYQAGELLLPKTEASAQRLGYSYQNLLTLFGQKEGYLADVIETPSDYRFLKIVKKYDAKLLAIGDVVQPDTTVTVYEYIRQNLGQQKQMQYLQYAAQELASSLNNADNVEMKKTGAALEKLLNWEN